MRRLAVKFFATRQSPLIALVLALALAGWLLSGQFGDSTAAEPEPATTAAPEHPPMSVQVREFEARPMTREIVVSGRSEPARSVSLRAEAEGRVTELVAERGAVVEAGQVIARLDTRDREAQRAQARATVKQRRLEYDGARKLGQRGFQGETQVAQAAAALEAAQAQLKHIEVELAHTAIKAPFTGVLDERVVELGDYVGVGDPVARLIDLDPIVVSAQVSQQQLSQFHTGDSASARLLTGETIAGTIRYIASAADDATRTFKAELEAANPDQRIAAGLTAELRIPTETVQAHYLSPALLALGDEGELGVKTVAADGTVEFNPVAIVQATPDGVWLTGLPERARVITVGQGFVHAGQQVRPVPEQAGSPEAVAVNLRDDEGRS